jgi:hypothetical protein
MGGGVAVTQSRVDPGGHHLAVDHHNRTEGKLTASGVLHRQCHGPSQESLLLYAAEITSVITLQQHSQSSIIIMDTVRYYGLRLPAGVLRTWSPYVSGTEVLPSLSSNMRTFYPNSRPMLWTPVTGGTPVTGWA